MVPTLGKPCKPVLLKAHLRIMASASSVGVATLTLKVAAIIYQKILSFTLNILTFAEYFYCLSSLKSALKRFGADFEGHCPMSFPSALLKNPDSRAMKSEASLEHCIWSTLAIGHQSCISHLEVLDKVVLNACLTKSNNFSKMLNVHCLFSLRVGHPPHCPLAKIPDGLLTLFAQDLDVRHDRLGFW